MVARIMFLGGMVALLSAPGYASAQILAGLGINGFAGQQTLLGAPPAGVGLHQQYMQLYGLPTTFTQGALFNNGGRAGIFPGYGGFGYGGIPRYFGVNYTRQLLAAQAYYNNAVLQSYYNGAGYGPTASAYPQSSSQSQSQSGSQTSFRSFNMTPVQRPVFGQMAMLSQPQSPGFSGFGLTNTANPFLAGTQPDENKAER